DGDGVKNVEDLCSKTPEGVTVDEQGCPLDSDKDGVPDYRDEEKSAVGALVDTKGSTINQDNSTSSETVPLKHNVIYKAYPSMEKAFVGTYYSADAPVITESKKSLGAFKVADQDGDDHISADEITWAIDAFFNGEIDFSAAKLHDLIDFFFNQ
ncbi:hypothetical protein ACFLR1_04970, partial [Bacteroidota bacterium]